MSRAPTTRRAAHVLLVVGARPNFVKLHPVWHELARRRDEVPGGLRITLVHTGQHYDRAMSDTFFEELRLPPPDVFLGVGSGTHAQQTAGAMMGIERVCLDERPDLVVVFGDVNSTMAAALVASKLCIPLAHVEAGLRSGDRTMPEEINRMVTDVLSDLCFTTSREAGDHLIREGVDPAKIHFTGNVMVDTLMTFLDEARQSEVLARLRLTGASGSAGYVVLTMHRPSNVDCDERMRAIVDALAEVRAERPVVFPVHPRTRRRLQEFGLQGHFASAADTDTGVRGPGLHLLDPMGYVDFLGLLAHASAVITDSGGVQEETTALGVPCFVLRNSTERPVTVLSGTSVLVGDELDRLGRLCLQVFEGRPAARAVRPELWDGRAAGRIVTEIVRYLQQGNRVAAHSS